MVSVRLPLPHLEALDRVAKRKSLSRSALVKKLIEATTKVDGVR